MQDGSPDFTPAIRRRSLGGMEAMSALLSRASSSKLVPPAPDGEVLARILDAGLRAPDHGALRPWRFLVVTGAGLARLAGAGEAALRRREPGAKREDVARAREKLTRAPMAIVLGARLREGHKIPVLEQELAVGAAAMNVLNALHASNFAGKWVTGPNAYDPEFARDLGYGESERIFGMIMAGTAEVPPVPGNVDPQAHVRIWD